MARIASRQVRWWSVGHNERMAHGAATVAKALQLCVDGDRSSTPRFGARRCPHGLRRSQRRSRTSPSPLKDGIFTLAGSYLPGLSARRSGVDALPDTVVENFAGVGNPVAWADRAYHLGVGAVVGRKRETEFNPLAGQHGAHLVLTERSVLADEFPSVVASAGASGSAGDESGDQIAAIRGR
jgi:hypothetical protein